MDQSIVKSCLSNDFYTSNKSKLRSSIFDDTLKDVYETIVQMHEKFEADISPIELFGFWKAKNPTSTAARTTEFEDLIGSIYNSQAVNPDIASDVIESLWRQSIGLDIANYGIKMSEDDPTAWDGLQALLTRVAEGYMPDDFGEPVTDDIYELLACASNDNRFKFNIETLSREVYGIGRGEFGCIAAYSNVGKTAFAVSLSAGPAGFCQQGAKVGYLANEEIAKKTKLRAVTAYTGLTVEQCELDPPAAYARYSGIRDRLIFLEITNWDMAKLDAYLGFEQYDLIFVDMADKIELSTKFASGHERLRELYYRLRELAKKHNCAIIGLSQASAEAEGKTRLTPTMLEGSKVGKIAECDILLGVGKMNSPEEPDDPTRWITVMKNKISGWHGTIICNLDIKTSRYEV